MVRKGNLKFSVTHCGFFDLHVKLVLASDVYFVSGRYVRAAWDLTKPSLLTGGDIAHSQAHSILLGPYFVSA